MQHTKIPFSLNRNDGHPLVVQLADGLRQAIIDGYYRPGDILPTYRDLAPIAGVSEIVTRGALKRLAEEGLGFVGLAGRQGLHEVQRDGIGLVAASGNEQRTRTGEQRNQFLHFLFLFNP